jgi:RimJ/RimL family protein N-acetyltransferase
MGSSHTEELRTERLLLRRWRVEDRAPFAAMNADPRVMEHFPGLLTREESDLRVDRIEAHFEKHGFAQWAVEIPGVAPFAGFVGLSVPPFEASFTPCVEVGWRLAVEYWGKGYATEGARAALAFGFNELQLNESDWNDARGQRRLRSPAAAGRPSIEPACAVSHCATLTLNQPQTQTPSFLQ